MVWRNMSELGVTSAGVRCDDPGNGQTLLIVLSFRFESNKLQGESGARLFIMRTCTSDVGPAVGKTILGPTYPQDPSSRGVFSLTTITGSTEPPYLGDRESL